MADKDKGMEPASNNDQLIRTVPGTDVGGHDTAGTDGEKRTERSGDILGTPNVEEGRFTEDHRKQEIEKADFITKEVDRTNREDLPRLGGETAPEEWEAEKGGSPEFLEKTKTSRKSTAKSSDKSVITARMPGTGLTADHK